MQSVFGRVCTTGYWSLASRRSGFHSSAAAWSFMRSNLPSIKNEPFLHYAPGSPERKELQEALARVKSQCPEVPLIIGGQEVRTNNVAEQVMPTKHQHVVCRYHQLDEKTVRDAIESNIEARKLWKDISWEDRASIFLKAADLLSTKYRQELNATVMLGTGKNAWQAEIDAAVETIDFWRFGVKYAQEIYGMQPPESTPGVWNRMEFRPLEGFVAAITPFNFIAIGANLPSTPALLGNAALWKPSHQTILGSYTVLKILQEAGLPGGVINFLPGDGPTFSKVALNDPRLAGLHFTGSTGTFQALYKQIANNIENYHSYPRIVGETGGKNFHFVHETADVDHVVFNTIRSAFEYSGQKCSACSRAYIPSNLWPQIKEKLVHEMKSVKVGQPDDFSTFMTSVIDQKAFDKITSFIKRAKQSPDCEIIAGGNFDDSEGYFIDPTIIVTSDPNYETMKEELFGPVLTIYVYSPDKLDETIQLCDQSAAYGLTGAIFAQDRYVLEKLNNAFRDSAGNFYINDKSTGSIVGQQPFGGARKSGTNDKSGSLLNLLRWVSARSIKESHMPVTDFRYPHMR